MVSLLVMIVQNYILPAYCIITTTTVAYNCTILPHKRIIKLSILSQKKKKKSQSRFNSSKRNLIAAQVVVIISIMNI